MLLTSNLSVIYPILKKHPPGGWMGCGIIYMYSANRTDKLMIEMRRGDGAGGAGVDIGLS